MKMLTVRLPEPLVAEIEAEARVRKVSKADVVRERLETAPSRRPKSSTLDAIADLAGSVKGSLPADLSARTKHHLRTKGYGQKRAR